MYHFLNIIVTFSLEIFKKKKKLSYSLNFNLDIEHFFIILFIYKYYLITKKKPN